MLICAQWFGYGFQSHSFKPTHNSLTSDRCLWLTSWRKTSHGPEVEAACCRVSFQTQRRVGWASETSIKEQQNHINSHIMMLNYSSLPCKRLGVFPALILVEEGGNSYSTNMSRQLWFYPVIIYIPKTPCPNKGTARTRMCLLAISLQATAPHTISEPLLSIWLMAQKDHMSWD